jgi:uncharacterized protein YraI
MKSSVWISVSLAALLVAPMALAQSDRGYTNTNANLRAGPDAGYPRIGTIPGGSSVQVYGCINDWSWCDVTWRGERGWLSAALLDYDYSGRRVRVAGYGAQIGLPILSFVFDSYWNDHYRSSSWYGERERWRGYRPAAAPQRPQQQARQQPPQKQLQQRQQQKQLQQRQQQKQPQKQQPQQQGRPSQAPPQQSRPQAQPAQGGRAQSQGTQGQGKTAPQPSQSRQSEEKRPS